MSERLSRLSYRQASLAYAVFDGKRELGQVEQGPARGRFRIAPLWQGTIFRGEPTYATREEAGEALRAWWDAHSAVCRCGHLDGVHRLPQPLGAQRPCLPACGCADFEAADIRGEPERRAR